MVSLTRQLRLIFRAPPGRPRYRPEQIALYLRGQATEPSDPEIVRMIERLPAILREPGVRRRYEGFQRYFDVLPRIVFLAHRRVPPARISQELSFLATDVGVETVLDITARLVADRLNQVS